jgi:hypothetical protein
LEKNLKAHYGNLKTLPETEDKYVYKQRSKSDKVDISQQVTVKIEDGIWGIGSYKNPKFKTLRKKRL